MLFILINFHMYWRIRVLQDTFVETTENVLEMRKGTSVMPSYESTKGKGPLT